MTITTKLRIENLYTDDTGIVHHIEWMLIASKGEHQAIRSGETDLDNPGDAATPFNHLTEQQVSDWITNKQADKIAEMESDLAVELEKLSNERRPCSPPWQKKRKPLLRPVVGRRDRRKKPSIK
jgi:hypothetical protein